MSDWTLHEEPHRHYRFNGSWNGARKQRIASVTQVLGGDDALNEWAARQALVAAEWVADNWLGAAPAMSRSLLSFGELAALSGLMPNQIRDSKGASGTAIHKYLYWLLTGEGVQPDAPYGLRMAIDAFVSEHEPELIAAEQAVGSYEWAVAGTYDVVWRIGGVVHRTDLKQSNSVRPSMLAQLAAYEFMDNEHTCDLLSILHIDACGNYKLHSIHTGGVDEARALDYFKSALTIYRNERMLAKCLR